jgi:hypothetical protein
LLRVRLGSAHGQRYLEPLNLEWRDETGGVPQCA